MPPAATKSEKHLAQRLKSMSQLRSLTLVELKGRHYLSMHAEYEVSIFYGSKVTPVTDRTKTICRRSFGPGHKKKRLFEFHYMYISRYKACTYFHRYKVFISPRICH